MFNNVGGLRSAIAHTNEKKSQNCFLLVTTFPNPPDRYARRPSLISYKPAVIDCFAHSISVKDSQNEMYQTTWLNHMALPHGWTTCPYHMAEPHGLTTWLNHMAQLHGQATWSDFWTEPYVLVIWTNHIADLHRLNTWPKNKAQPYGWITRPNHSHLCDDL